MCVDAANLIKITDATGKTLYPIKAINVLKAHGKSSKESRLIHGYALNCTRANDGRVNLIYLHHLCTIFRLLKVKFLIHLLLIFLRFWHYVSLAW